MEMQQYKAEEEAVEREASKYGVSGQFTIGIKNAHSIRMQLKSPGKEVQYIQKNTIKDGIVLREIWVQQALILISQVHCSDLGVLVPMTI